MLQNIVAFWTETALTIRHAEVLHLQDYPPRCDLRPEACIRARGPADGGACATPSNTWKPRRCRCSSSPRNTKTRYDESLSRRHAADRALRKEPPFASVAATATRSGSRRWCCVASRSPACAMSQLAAATVFRWRNRIRPAWVMRWTRNSPKALDRFWTSRNIPTCANHRTVRSNNRSAAGWTLQLQMGVKVVR